MCEITFNSGFMERFLLEPHSLIIVVSFSLWATRDSRIPLQNWQLCVNVKGRPVSYFSERNKEIDSRRVWYIHMSHPKFLSWRFNIHLTQHGVSSLLLSRNGPLFSTFSNSSCNDSALSTSIFMIIFPRNKTRNVSPTLLQLEYMYESLDSSQSWQLK